jgi:pyruvate,orthophosphate dikinase
MVVGEISGASSEPLVHNFGDGRASSVNRNLLGGKGSGLAEMSRLGIPVPPGLTITTDVCNAYFASGRIFPRELSDQVSLGLTQIEEISGTLFGDPSNPLLLSVRSGARVSMPGMMDTILNLGLNDETAEGLAAATGNARFAYDSYRRFVQMYGDVVMGVGKLSETDHDPFELILSAKKSARNIQQDTDFSELDLRELVTEFKELIFSRSGELFPENVTDQLWGAIGAVFESWDTPRAVSYRSINGYSSTWGTAVNVQAMVFGNFGNDSGTGVLFTRNPSTGENRLFGEYLINAQGEDVVAGIRTPQPLLAELDMDLDGNSLEETMPEVFAELVTACDLLEKSFHDMQDIEFTMQQGKLWILQARSGKRSGAAMVKICVDLVKEGILLQKDALRKLDPNQLNEILHPVFEQPIKHEVIANGLAAAPGAAVGIVVFSPADVVRLVSEGRDVILVRDETSPEDIDGMNLAKGILTARGGMTSHAAVVARGMGLPCVTGCNDLRIDYQNSQFSIERSDGRLIVKAGDVISIDGGTGQVILGSAALIEATPPIEYDEVMTWVDAGRSLRIRANADTPEDARKAREFGAEGIGLCRTEHMFFGSDRIHSVRKMILAASNAERITALQELLPHQRQDFTGILRAMSGFPVTIRLLDPPLHEFLPQSSSEISELAGALNISVDELTNRVHALEEVNPMLGHRGVRLAVTYPEIYQMQTRAIIEASCDLMAEGVDVEPEIMIPLVGLGSELEQLRALVHKTAEIVLQERDCKIEFLVGTMIEVPRACVVAGEISEHADFFSFGTNDLTQTTFGFSRDDVGKFLPDYLAKGLLTSDPFVEIDRDGVGGLIKQAVDAGRKQKPDLKMGICGEHGGDPSSIYFCHSIGLNYVSASPYRVPIARLAAAQAAIDFAAS